MDPTIAALLIQDGVTNGAIYALLALALVLVFAVTRVIWVPSGEFVAYATLTLAGLQLGKPPGTVGLLVGMAVVAGVMEVVESVRLGEARRLPRRLALWTVLPCAIAALLALEFALRPWLLPQAPRRGVAAFARAVARAWPAVLRD
jgi:branched-chain amino acid transport system permease protein